MLPKYENKVLEMSSFSSQARITSNKNIAYFKSRFYKSIEMIMTSKVVR